MTMLSILSSLIQFSACAAVLLYVLGFFADKFVRNRGGWDILSLGSIGKASRFMTLACLILMVSFLAACTFAGQLPLAWGLIATSFCLVTALQVKKSRRD